MDMAICAISERRNTQVRKPDVWERESRGGCTMYLRYYHGHYLCIEHIHTASLMFLTIDGKLQDVNYNVHDITSVEATLIRKVDHNTITNRGGL